MRSDATRATAVRCAALTSVLVVVLAAASAARGETYATMRPRLYPDRPGAMAAVTLRAGFSESSALVPSPLRSATLSFPAGLTLQVPHLRSCTAARLRMRGPRDCPAQSALGRGRAVVEAQMGSQTMRETISLRLFLGPLHNLQPTLMLYARGRTPFDEHSVIAGSARAADPPYGEQIVLAIPPIGTIPLEPDASIVAFSLTVGDSHRARSRRGGNAVRVSSRCPAGGFPVAGEFVYADGQADSVDAEIPCPEGSKKEATEHANASRA